VRREVEAARTAYRLWSDETLVGSVAAVAVVAVVVGVPAARLWRASRSGGGA
jgi:hypothetical protein